MLQWKLMVVFEKMGEYEGTYLSTGEDENEKSSSLFIASKLGDASCCDTNKSSFYDSGYFHE